MDVTENHKIVPAIFPHIQKTAGTSIVKIAEKHYGNSIITHGEYVGHDPNEFRDVAFVSGHFGYSFARHFLSERYSFTFLRSPVERVLSFYYYCKRRESNLFLDYGLSHNPNLNDFLEHSLNNNMLTTAIRNNQVWQLAYGYGHRTKRGYFDFEEKEMLDLAIKHIEEYSYIGFVETFDEDRNIIMTQLGIPIYQTDYETSEKLDSLPDGIEFKGDLGKLIKYIQESQQLVYKGVMPESTKNVLLDLSKDAEYRKVINNLFQKSHFVENDSGKRPPAKDLPGHTMELLEELTHYDCLLYDHAKSLRTTTNISE